LPELLKWIQDMNWPVARVIAPLLRQAGPEIVTHVGAVLRSDDDIWKYWVLLELTRSWADDLFDEVKVEVERIALSPTPSEELEGAAEEARNVLALRGRPF
jgi:hypothetical protein